MQYHEAANFLFDLRRFQVKPGTESVRELLAHLGDPHADVRFVQIAGSNGKGSTARMVESVCREAGLDTGLYTSPHFDDLRERIRVDGRKIPERAVAAFVDEVEPYLVDRAAAGEPLTFFEVVTAMGLWQFGRADVDVAVLEVGMGGAMDATSVVDPVASAVTNVTREHTAVLGDTVREIATKKAAVAPADAPLVTAATGEALEVLRREAGELIVVGDGTSGGDDGNGVEDRSENGDEGSAADADVVVDYRGRVTHQESRVEITDADGTLSARLPLLGAYQASNAGVATTLARQVADVDGETVVRGLRNAHWPGRFEVVEREPTVVLDGAHNADACEELARTLGEFDFDALHLVFAAMHDKDHRGMAAAFPEPDSVVTCRPEIDRAEDPDVLARVFESAGVDDVRAEEAVADAVRAARGRADPGDCVLVAGSLFLIAEARRPYTRVGIPKRVDDLDDAGRVLAGANVEESVGDGASAGVDGDAESESGVVDADDQRADVVHRVLKTRVSRRHAGALREEMLAADGACAASGLRSGGEVTDVVLSGTLAQFSAVAHRLDGRAGGLPEIAEEIRDAFDLRGGAGGGAVSGTEAGGRAESGTGLGPGTGAKAEGSARPDYPWEEHTAVMGILNVTPDSFHDGGEFLDLDAAVERATAMVDAGAEIVDVGGESTRPGAEPVPVEEEKRRVVPVVEAIADLDAAVSIDTRRAEVGRAALDAGADVLNDVTGLADPEMRFLAAEREVPVIVMHSIDAPVVPGRTVEYDDVVEDVIDELQERVLLAEKAGIPRHRVIVDPGIGFGKSGAESFEILGRVGEFRALGCPVLVGHSHKSMFELVGGSAGDDLAGTVAGSTIAAANGADIVRVHDVAENVRGVRAAEAASDPAALLDGDEGGAGNGGRDGDDG